MSVTDRSPESAPFSPLPQRRPASSNGAQGADGDSPSPHDTPSPPAQSSPGQPLPRRGGFPPQDPPRPPTQNSHGQPLPRRGGPPQQDAPRPPTQSQPPQSQPPQSQPLPQRLPTRGGAPGGAAPGSAPAGAPGAQTASGNGGTALPRRGAGGRSRRTGRHRSLHRISVASDAPALVLAVPGWIDDAIDLARHVAEEIGRAHV